MRLLHIYVVNAQAFKRARICQDFVLLDSEQLAQEASFYGLMSAFLLQIINPRTSTLAATGQLAEVTSRSFPPMMFSALPEYYVDDIGEFLVFLIQYDRFDLKPYLPASETI